MHIVYLWINTEHRLCSRQHIWFHLPNSNTLDWFQSDASSDGESLFLCTAVLHRPKELVDRSYRSSMQRTSEAVANTPCRAPTNGCWWSCLLVVYGLLVSRHVSSTRLKSTRRNQCSAALITRSASALCQPTVTGRYCQASWFYSRFRVSFWFDSLTAFIDICSRVDQ